MMQEVVFQSIEIKKNDKVFKVNNKKIHEIIICKNLTS